MKKQPKEVVLDLPFKKQKTADKGHCCQNGVQAVQLLLPLLQKTHRHDVRGIPEQLGDVKRRMECHIVSMFQTPDGNHIHPVFPPVGIGSHCGKHHQERWFAHFRCVKDTVEF